MEPRLLTLLDVAAYLSVGRSTVLRMVNRGDLPEPVRLGGCVRWDRQAIDRALDARGGSVRRFDDPDEAIEELARARRKDRAAAAR